MYNLVPKKKTKVLKQRTMLEMFKELQQSASSPQVWAPHVYLKRHLVILHSEMLDVALTPI